MDKKKRLLKRKQKRSLEKNRRAKKLKKQRNMRKTFKKIERQMMPQPQQKGLRMAIYTLWRDFILFLMKVGCKVGIHNWKLCSGLPGQPKYACIRCWARSKETWGDGGSSKHYELKEKENEKTA